jgi:hypothetical protein
MQRQLRLGDILDDYCPRERRLTNHAVVAMVGEDVKQTRCTTCDAEHEYKHAKVPRQRKKADTPAALYSQVLAGGPKRREHPVQSPAAAPLDDEAAVDESPAADAEAELPADLEEAVLALSDDDHGDHDDELVEHDGDQVDPDDRRDEGPVHRPLIRASLPRQEGQQPPQRPIPEFTIRQPGGRPNNRFRPRHGGGRGPQMAGNRSNGNLGGGNNRGGMPRYGGGRPPQGGMSARPPKRHGQGRNKRSK